MIISYPVAYLGGKAGDVYIATCIFLSSRDRWWIISSGDGHCWGGPGIKIYHGYLVHPKHEGDGYLSLSYCWSKTWGITWDVETPVKNVIHHLSTAAVSSMFIPSQNEGLQFGNVIHVFYITSLRISNSYTNPDNIGMQQVLYIVCQWRSKSSRVTSLLQF